MTARRLTILYFAWLRERTGTAEESVVPPASVATVADLVAWLRARSPGHEAAFARPEVIRCAVNQDFAAPTAPLADGDEVAFFPRSPAGSMGVVRVQTEDFDVGAAFAALTAGRQDIGGIGCFVGTVRADAAVVALTLEHYPAMTQRALERIAAEAERRWSLLGCTIIHRHGRLAAGANIVLVLAAAAHRQPALDATAFLIDWLKTRAPFWKQEEHADGSARWVEARAADDQAAARWMLG